MAELTREDFHTRLRVIGLKPGTFAALTGLRADTVYRWGGQNDFPAWVQPFLAACEGLHAAHGREWLAYIVERLKG